LSSKPKKTKDLRHADPHREREAAKYDKPIPSRELILEVLEREGVPVMTEALASLLGIKASEAQAFDRRLAAMEREGQVMRNRRGAILVSDKAGLIKGKVVGHPDGFGFLRPEDGSDDLFLGPKQMHKALHGDTVLARVTGLDRRGRREGSVVEVLERAHSRVVGRLFVEQGVMFVVAEDQRLSQDFLVPPDGAGKARAGQVVVAEIIQQPTPQSEPIARVIEVLGNYADPGMEIEIALRKHALPFRFSAAAQAQAENVLTGALRQLFALSEAYPDLKANQNFLNLQEELTATEDRISYARQFYNDSVQTYNTSIQTFPRNMIAGMFNFQPREFFQAADGSAEVPRVQF